MINEINQILLSFYHCFNRGTSFKWFVVAIMGFYVRTDHYGVSSMIRWLGLKPRYYESLLHFFRATSWNLDNVMRCWFNIVKSYCRLVTIDGFILMVCDGIKISKEAKYTPAVKKLHQDSNNSSKPSYFNGHHYGVLGILAGDIKQKIFCIPLLAELHEDMEKLRKIQGKPSPKVEGKELVSLTSLMTLLAKKAVSGCGMKTLLVLDGFFSVRTTFLMAKDLLDSSGNRLLHIITRAKKNVIAYDTPHPKTGERGRPRIYGKEIKLQSLFKTRVQDFTETVVEVYKRQKTIKYLCLDLIWKPIKDKIRFVLVIDGDNQFILMCSELNMDPAKIIIAYSYRFKIEVSFKVMKHSIGAFSHRFWTLAWPKFNKKEKTNLNGLCEKRTRLIANTTNTIENFVNLGCIATGILQILALNKGNIIKQKYQGWLRTISSNIPSEETVVSVVRQEYCHNFNAFKNTTIYGIIMSKFNSNSPYKDTLAS